MTSITEDVPCSISVCSMYYAASSRMLKGLMSDDKSSDEFFMKIREKGEKERKNVVVVFFAIKIALSERAAVPL